MKRICSDPMSLIEDQAVILLLVVPYPIIIVLAAWVTILSGRIRKLERTIKDDKGYWVLK